MMKRTQREGMKPDLDAYAPLQDMLLEMGRVAEAEDLIAQTSEKKADD